MKKMNWIVYGVLGVCVVALGIVCMTQRSEIQQLESELTIKTTEVTESMRQVENLTSQPDRDVQVRLFYGQVQYQLDGVWQDACSLEELNASDPLEKGLTAMQDIIKENQEKRSAEQSVEENSPSAILARDMGVIEKERPAVSTPRRNNTTTAVATPAPTPVPVQPETPSAPTPSNDNSSNNSQPETPPAPAAPAEPEPQATPEPEPEPPAESGGSDGEDIGWSGDVL